MQLCTIIQHRQLTTLDLLHHIVKYSHHTAAGMCVHAAQFSRYQLLNTVLNPPCTLSCYPHCPPQARSSPAPCAPCSCPTPHCPPSPARCTSRPCPRSQRPCRPPRPRHTRVSSHSTCLLPLGHDVFLLTSDTQATDLPCLLVHGYAIYEYYRCYSYALNGSSKSMAIAWSTTHIHSAHPTWRCPCSPPCRPTPQPAAGLRT